METIEQESLSHLSNSGSPQLQKLLPVSVLWKRKNFARDSSGFTPAGGADDLWSMADMQFALFLLIVLLLTSTGEPQGHGKVSQCHVLEMGRNCDVLSERELQHRDLAFVNVTAVVCLFIIVQGVCALLALVTGGVSQVTHSPPPWRGQMLSSWAE